MQKQKKTALTESQVKLKKYLKPIVEGILSEQPKGQFEDFVVLVQREFLKTSKGINTVLNNIRTGKDEYTTNEIRKVLEYYFDNERNPNYDDAILKLINFYHESV